jgi:hypothetical protein
MRGHRRTASRLPSSPPTPAVPIGTGQSPRCWRLGRVLSDHRMVAGSYRPTGTCRLGYSLRGGLADRLPCQNEAMADLHTQEGRPLKRSGDRLFARSGIEVARLKGDKAFGPDGRYVGTIVGNRLVYRSTHSARIGSSFSPSQRAGTASANRVGSATMGDEPPIPD